MFRRNAGNSGKTEGDRKRIKEMDFSWKDIIAMVIAAYQVLLPYVLGMAAVFLILLSIFSLLLG